MEKEKVVELVEGFKVVISLKEPSRKDLVWMEANPDNWAGE